MSKDKGREFNGDRKEFHLYFGQEAELGRRYNVWSGERYTNPYIYENDQEMAERHKRFEELEQLDKEMKKRQLEHKLKNEGLDTVLNDIFEE
ncbi:hypothetical protein [Clostridium beijerinckii]|uniref:hypothetical protein n=1 Tax=Clostridium beijerinckii TaxID=1520 RepID=UPI0015712B86|nr:hypothetical protein [Clostridium beijerinckii]NRU52535.1 hypothetical protein [Clostridium beijerinckii]NYC69288.1 hypothetical protein [Clostridium beijerinckii]NYC91736.1 hypothetical protein [Clostridium beijerinckii]